MYVSVRKTERAKVTNQALNTENKLLFSSVFQDSLKMAGKKSRGQRQKDIGIRQNNSEMGAQTAYGTMKFWFVAAQIIPDSHRSSAHYKSHGMEGFKGPVWVRGHTLMNTTAFI